MNGKKFLALFLGVTIVIATLLVLSIKKGYETRPKVPEMQPIESPQAVPAEHK